MLYVNELPRFQTADHIPDELRVACAPFFEQMLAVLRDSQKMQVHPSDRLIEITQAMVRTTSTSLPCGLQLESRSLSSCARTLDQESTEADDLGAFACLLSSSSSEAEDAEVKSSGSDSVCAPPTPIHDLDQSSDVEKSSMVCRHWKSKGWCRLGDNCKFLHPEHKRGVTATKACGGHGQTSCSDSAQIDGDLPVARRRRRGGRNRSNKNGQADSCHPGQEVCVAQQNCYLDEYPVLCFSSAFAA